MWSQSCSHDKNKTSFPLALKSLCLCSILTAFSIYIFSDEKMACAWSISFSSYTTVHYSMEQAMSMVIDDQSPDVLATDSDSSSV